jgi:hypothetical protein
MSRLIPDALEGLFRIAWRGHGLALLACLGLAASGCSSSPQHAGDATTEAAPTAATSPGEPIQAPVAEVASAKTPAAPNGTTGAKSRRTRNSRPATPPKPATVDTAESPLGRVVTANLILKFAVIDFSLRPMPAIGVEMLLYRGTQRVGQVRISGPVLDGHIVADIIAGDAATGDEVRLD